MTVFGLPPTSRLLRAGEFRAVFSNARFKVSCRHFLVLGIPNEAATARLGLVVSRKNVPAAIQRNRVKRLIREGFRKRRAELCGVDLVVLARKDAHKLANVSINQKLNGLWNDLMGKMRGGGANNRQESPLS